MILIRPDADPMQLRAPIFEVGCAGRIAESERLADGRFNLLLHGERRFRVLREVEANSSFRSVDAELLRGRALPVAPARGSAAARRPRATSSRRACSSSCA